MKISPVSVIPIFPPHYDFHVDPMAGPLQVALCRRYRRSFGQRVMRGRGRAQGKCLGPRISSLTILESCSPEDDGIILYIFLDTIIVLLHITISIKIIVIIIMIFYYYDCGLFYVHITQLWIIYVHITQSWIIYVHVT